MRNIGSKVGDTPTETFKSLRRILAAIRSTRLRPSSTVGNIASSPFLRLCEMVGYLVGRGEQLRKHHLRRYVIYRMTLELLQLLLVAVRSK
jgi:hypothetical protein